MSETPFRFTPCHERWEQMTPSERGRLCAKCNTEIVDFRNSTEAEIENTIATSTAKICGYYSIAQFQKPGSRLATAATAATIALAFPAFTEGAQQSAAATPVPNVASTDSTVIRGIVKDSVSGTPIVGAPVMIAERRIGAITDRDGRFRILTREKFDRPVSLKAEFIGYWPRTIEVTAGDTKEVEFALPQAAINIVGIVVTPAATPVTPPRPSFWRRLWNFLGG